MKLSRLNPAEDTRRQQQFSAFLLAYRADKIRWDNPFPPMTGSDYAESFFSLSDDTRTDLIDDAAAAELGLNFHDGYDDDEQTCAYGALAAVDGLERWRRETAHKLDINGAFAPHIGAIAAALEDATVAYAPLHSVLTVAYVQALVEHYATPAEAAELAPYLSARLAETVEQAGLATTA